MDIVSEQENYTHSKSGWELGSRNVSGGGSDGGDEGDTELEYCKLLALALTSISTAAVVEEEFAEKT